MIKRHKHAGLIIAKANNMDLVVFSDFGSGKWTESQVDYNESFYFLAESNYFLCLPQHKEACLHWLNGGKAQSDRSCEGFVSVDAASYYDFKWWEGGWFMREDYNSRIKPRKEKRWIAVRKKDLYVEEFAFKDIDSAKEYNDTELWSYHEIEVEV